MTASPTAFGDRALLLEFPGTTAVLTAAAALRTAALPGVVDIVPGARTVLLVLDGPASAAGVRRRLGGLALPEPPEAPPPPAGTELVIEVNYDGDDLDEVAGLTGLSRAEVIAAHTGRPWRVGFVGFAPGFGYLTSGDPRLTVPRRATPRTRVPAGAVGLAGEFCGVYPRESPGGWQLIGRTDARMWDIERDPPTLLRPGAWVRFREIVP
ncbi:allophanate hydrolase [Mycolicibacterium insubricum]|uniref:Allophanate hydrolase n=1 Tax=Mycolicibacterium insubricum TaxID=444597 RepID=A0A1X0DEY4_9MYCO|nr:allophanate hydrolase subunit 1 [Mycolicibacterium insubricum]MCB0928531.1 allophanate hydrolase subunit 1 [Mycobacterium sp.]MCV7082274.1 allophanate hydrolase subunit 1 [Mycolicibacterium insubricum]ORA70943.1 allophanate hydrolase [Mycolicibacterium insubricum]BBZ65438.1 allophanate hydrolase [Mycolicibacterium insubricum]